MSPLLGLRGTWTAQEKATNRNTSVKTYFTERPSGLQVGEGQIPGGHAHGGKDSKLHRSSERLSVVFCLCPSSPSLPLFVPLLPGDGERCHTSFVL